MELSLVMKVVIIDNHQGNIGSVINALIKLNQKFEVSNNKNIIKSSDAIIFPGVGAFPQAMINLKKNGLIDTLKEQLMHKKKPYLGICLGMQILAELSEEQTLTKGLSFIKGNVKILNKKKFLTLPNVGWRKINFQNNSSLFKNISQGSFFYFDHSYSLTQVNKKFILATTNIGKKIISIVKKKNLVGVQFHPEKSQINGLRLIKNFLQFAKKII